VHRPCRVVRGDVQCFEIVKVIFDFRSLDHIEARTRKQARDSSHGKRDRVQTTASLPAPREGDIDVVGSRGIEECVFQCLLAHGKCFGNLVTDTVDSIARCRPFLGREPAKPLEEIGDKPLLAKKSDPHGLQQRRGIRRRYLGEGLLMDARDIGSVTLLS